MKTARVILIFLFCTGAASGVVLADKLPKSGVPMTAAQVTALYSDHTAVWAPTAMAYFAADGTVRQFDQGLSKPGTWAVKDNEVCMAIQGVDPATHTLVGKTFTDCFQWFVDSKKRSYSLYTKHWDDAKPDLTTYDSHAAKVLKPGDLIGDKYVAPQS